MNKNNFIFFHGYDEKMWDGFVKRGFVDSNAGIRICQSLLLDESRKFNQIAGIGSALYELICENRFPIYIDRLQGGAYFEDYQYDMQLIDHYREMLGDDFYGFQMHEWMSNMRSDYDKFKELSGADITQDKITKLVFEKFKVPFLFLEAASAAEFAKEFPPPENLEDFFRTGEKLFKKRQAYTKNSLLPCDSAMMAVNLEFKLGTKRIMPEIGAQTSGTNVQLAYARGMAKAYKRAFGAYYEPWGGSPFSVCSYPINGKNEWNICDNKEFPFKACGAEGGSSRSLQKRMYFYAYLAGASFMSEEWGLYNTFYDGEDFALTPYGEAKAAFLRFTKKYSPGVFYAPVAIVLPKDLPVLDNVDNITEKWFGNCSFRSPFSQRQDRAVKEGIRSLMRDSLSQYGNETRSLINSNVPDAFDIIHEDCEHAFSDYRYLVDLTGNPDFARSHHHVVSVQEAKHIMDSLMPCNVSGGLHWFMNQTDNGWYLTVFNNDGIDKSVEKGEIQMDQADRTAVIDIKENSALVRLEGSRNIELRDRKYYVELKAGEYFFAFVS